MMNSFAKLGLLGVTAAFTFAAMFVTSSVDAQEKKKAKRPPADPEVREERMYIPRTPWMAAFPGGPKGYTVILGLMEKDPNAVLKNPAETDPMYNLKRGEYLGGKGRAVDDGDQVTSLIAEAKSWRDSTIAQVKDPKWAAFGPGAGFVKTEHFTLMTDIDKTSLQTPKTPDTGFSGSADLVKATISYGARAERIWRDYAAIVGEDIASYHSGYFIFLWNKGEIGRKKRNVVLREVFEDYLTADHKTGGMNMISSDKMNMWWDNGLPDDEHLWEHFVHNTACMILMNHTARYGGDNSGYGWLSEGFAFYLTRIHNEHDNCTTMQFEEGFEGIAHHVDGGESGWLAWARAMVKKGLRQVEYKDGVLQKTTGDQQGYYEFKDIVNFKVNQMPTDARVQAWAMVKFLIDVYEGGGEFARKKFVGFLDAVKGGKEKKVEQEVKEAYGFTMKEWEEEWVKWLKDPKKYEGDIRAKKAVEAAETEKARKKAEKDAKKDAAAPAGAAPAGAAPADGAAKADDKK